MESPALFKDSAHFSSAHLEKPALKDRKWLFIEYHSFILAEFRNLKNDVCVLGQF